jgi:hypothetical protein
MKKREADFFNKESNNRSFKMYMEDNDSGYQKYEKLPDQIDGTYIYDYNILEIDKIILKKFEENKNHNLSDLENNLTIEKIKIVQRQNLIERKNSIKKIEELENKIFSYNEDVNKKKYLLKATNLLEAYKKIKPISTIISFTNNSINDEIKCQETLEEQNYRHKIISEYLEIARKYIKIDLIRKMPPIKDCCLNPDIFTDESGSDVCNNCGLEKINIIKTQFYADSSRLNNSKNNYEDRNNFIKVLMRFQGKQINKPAKELYEELDKYFISRGLKTSEEYKSLPLLADGTKDGTSREMMIEALSNIGCSGHYDDINLICSIFFGWKLPDISHLEDDIMQDYDDFQKVYESLPDLEGRKSTLNSQWKLYILLLRRGYPCKSKDFKIPTTPSILEFHKIKTKKVYDTLGWKCSF